MRRSATGAVLSAVLGCGPAPQEDDGLDETSQTSAADPEAMLAMRLSETGLFLGDASTLAPGVRRFAPAFPLWSDGTDKERFVWLPPATLIDTHDPDTWRYPEGTKLWKTFLREGVRLETRMLEKRPEGWIMIAYAWDDAQVDAVAVPDGRRDVLGTMHDIPNEDDCRACHFTATDVVLGFTALQLGPGTGDLVGLDALRSEGRFTAPVEDRVPPGTPAQRDALGYLHANCGSCHRPGTEVLAQDTPIDLWLTASSATVETTPMYRTTVGQPSSLDDEGAQLLVAAGRPEESALWLRMAVRDRRQMPPLGSERVDDAALSRLSAFISELQDDGSR